MDEQLTATLDDIKQMVGGIVLESNMTVAKLQRVIQAQSAQIADLQKQLSDLKPPAQ